MVLLTLFQINTEEQANAYWCKLPSIGEYNVQSYVCIPVDGLHDGPKLNEQVQGYALSGGGRFIQRVGKLQCCLFFFELLIYKRCFW